MKQDKGIKKTFRKYKELGTKKFFKRWGEGIEGITPLQEVKTSMIGTGMILIGVLFGIIVDSVVRLKNFWWWTDLILVGSFIVTTIQIIGQYKKYKIHKRIEQTMKEIENA
jgi:hypothetical protein